LVIAAAEASASSSAPMPSSQQRPLPLQEAERGNEARAKRKRARCSEIVGDEMFLPVHVQKQRREDPSHWACKHRPPAKPPRTLTPPPAPRDGQGEDLWMAHEREKRELCRGKRMESRSALAQALLASEEEDERELPEKEEPLGSDAEPEEYEMLSPEESEAKRDIWNEVNKDLLMYWALAEERRRRKREEADQLKRKREVEQRERKQQADLEEQRRAARLGRRTTTARGRAGKRDGAGAAGASAWEEVDATVMDFWQAHCQSNEANQFVPSAVQEEEENNASQEARAREAQLALLTALQEEQEQRELLRRARRAADEINDLFGL